MRQLVGLGLKELLPDKEVAYFFKITDPKITFVSAHGCGKSDSVGLEQIAKLNSAWRADTCSKMMGFDGGWLGQPALPVVGMRVPGARQGAWSSKGRRAPPRMLSGNGFQETPHLKNGLSTGDRHDGMKCYVVMWRGG